MLKRLFERESESMRFAFLEQRMKNVEKKENTSIEKENKWAPNSQKRNHGAKEESHLLHFSFSQGNYASCICFQPSMLLHKSTTYMYTLPY